MKKHRVNQHYPHKYRGLLLEINLILCISFILLLTIIGVHLAQQHNIVSFKSTPSSFTTEPIVIYMHTDDCYDIQWKRQWLEKITWTTLRQQLYLLQHTSKKNPLVVWIKGKETITYATLLKVIHLLQSLKIESVGLITTVPV